MSMRLMGERGKVPLLFFDWLIKICVIVWPGRGGVLCRPANNFSKIRKGKFCSVLLIDEMGSWRLHPESV